MPSEPEQSSKWTVLVRHPVMAAVTVVCLVLGGVVGVFVFPEEWHVARSIVLGVFLGAWCALLIIGWRLLTSLGETEG